MAHAGSRFAHVESRSCPKCGQPRQVEQTECRSCGIVFAKYRSVPAPATPVLTTTRVAPPGPRLSGRELETLLSTLSAALGAGMTPAAFADSAAVKQLPAVAGARIRADLTRGVPLSQTLGSLGPLDDAELALFRAREAHGEIALGLHDLAERLARKRKDLTRAGVSLAYPGFMAFLATLILPLPLVTKGAWAYLSRALPAAFLVVAAGVVAFVVIPRMAPQSAVRRALRRIGWAIPFSGGALRHQAFATFADLLGSCLAAGLPAREALSLTCSASDHPKLRGSGPMLVSRIEHGSTLTEALASTGALPAGFIAQVDAGERAGTLDRILPALAKDHQQRSRVSMMIALGALAAIALIALMGVIAWRVVVGWSDIFQGQGRDLDKILRP